MVRWDIPPVTKKMVEAAEREVANEQYQFLNFEGVSLINSLCLQNKEPFMVVNENRVKSALGNQYQPYERLELAFASMYKSLILNHGFANGNKRTAVIALYIGSLLLGNELKILDKDFATLIYKIASENGGLTEVEDIATQVFSKHEVKKEERLVNNLENVVKDYINKHKWLMDELAK